MPERDSDKAYNIIAGWYGGIRQSHALKEVEWQYLYPKPPTLLDRLKGASQEVVRKLKYSFTTRTMKNFQPIETYLSQEMLTWRPHSKDTP
jgi:hypothetical protein